MKNKTNQKKTLAIGNVCADARVNIYAGQRTGSRGWKQNKTGLVVGGG